MKPIDIKHFSKELKFITRERKEVKLIKYIPEANPKNKLLFLHNGNVLGCDEHGKCHSVNNYDSNFTDTDFTKYDVFVDNTLTGYINIVKTDNGYSTTGIYNSIEEAKKNVSSKLNFVKTIKIEWSIE